MAASKSPPTDPTSPAGAGAEPGTAASSVSSPRKGKFPPIAVKVAIGAALVGVLGFAFIRSVKNSVATPYTVDPSSMRNWTLALDPTGGPGDPLLVLQPPPELARGLFNQVFKRVMESMEVPGAPVIPLLVRREFDRAFGGAATPEALLAAARAAGLDAAAFQPRCLAHRRVSDPAGTQQLYFVLFDSPAFVAFRQQLATSAIAGTFDPAAQSPLLLVSVSNSTFGRWLPLRADPTTDCVAAVAIASADGTATR